MSIEEIKAEIAKQEKALSNPKLFALMGDKIQAKVDTLKKQLSDLEGKAETKVEDAEKKVEEAVTKEEKKDAKKDLAEAKEEKKEVANTTEKVEKVEKKVFVAGVAEVKAEIAKQEKALSNPKLFALMGDKIQAKVDGLKKQLEQLEGKAETKVEDAEKKVEEAVTKDEKKDAKKDLTEAKEEKKEVEKLIEKADKVEKKVGGFRLGAGRKPIIGRMEKPKGNWGGNRKSAGRKASSTNTKMVKPKGANVNKLKIKERKPKAKVKANLPAKIENKVVKVKSVRAFGQKIEYKNDSDFCSKLIIAFKKRKKASKGDGKRKKTTSTFGTMTNSIRKIVSGAVQNVPQKRIEANPKKFMSDAQKVEKSGVRFLEDLKEFLGYKYSKSQIEKEFVQYDELIKGIVAKATKK